MMYTSTCTMYVLGPPCFPCCKERKAGWGLMFYCSTYDSHLVSLKLKAVGHFPTLLLLGDELVSEAVVTVGGSNPWTGTVEGKMECTMDL